MTHKILFISGMLFLVYAHAIAANPENKSVKTNAPGKLVNGCYAYSGGGRAEWKVYRKNSVRIMRMTVTRLHEWGKWRPSGCKGIFAGFMFGETSAGKQGENVKPSTWYKCDFMYAGSVKLARIMVYCWNGKGQRKILYYPQRVFVNNKWIRKSNQMDIPVSEDWQHAEARFKTFRDTVRAAVFIGIYDPPLLQIGQILKIKNFTLSPLY